jgi:hypothetical protein
MTQIKTKISNIINKYEYIYIYMYQQCTCANASAKYRGQAAKWHLHRFTRELDATDAVRTLHY